MPFMCMIIAWANIGFLNDYNFHDLNSDNIIANGMILIFMLGCFDLFRGEFASVGIWSYVIVGIAIVSIVLMVLANTGDPDFKKVE